MTRIVVLSFILLLAAGNPAGAQAPRPPVGPSGSVTLTRVEYDRLLDLAARRPATVDGLPTSGALTRADIRVRIDGGIARATMRLDGEVFRPGVAKIPLIKDATLLDAGVDNRALPIVTEGGTHFALVSGPAAFSASLEAGASVVFSPGRASFVLPVPHAGSATASIDVPGEQADVRVSSGLIVRRASANGRTVVEVTLPTGRPAEVSWSTHEAAPTAAARHVRLLADVKSVVTIGDSDVRLVSLINASILQGEPSNIGIVLPAGYEVASVSGTTLDRSETQPGLLLLHVADVSARRHQFLLTLERAHAGGSARLDTGLPGVRGAQRENGEVAIEGLGTIEISSPEMPGLRRVDVRELDPAVSSIARDTVLAAYRYQHAGDEPPALTVNVRRFANASVLAAVGERAVATTLITSEGRALTEVTLWLRNRAQAFMKVALPAGASIVSVEVAGSTAKPVEGADGSRVPLLRPGFRPQGTYSVSFVYLHAGAPFAKKGDMQMTLPKMDVPINVVEWELFVPEQFRADRFGGNVIDASLVLLRHTAPGSVMGPAVRHGMGGGPGARRLDPSIPMRRAQIAGQILDETGAVVPGVSVAIESGGQRQTVVTDENGVYVAPNVNPGTVTLTAQLEGFRPAKRSVLFTGEGQRVDLTLGVGSMTETITVMAESQVTQSSRDERQQNEAPSANVQNLQRRIAGVLPVRVDVPRSGVSHRFVRPLVIDEESLVTFRYKRR
jgi:hypothetical protein